MNEKITAAISSATERYAGSASLRTAVQLIPYIGGPLDTLLEGKGSEIRMRRLEAFVRDVSIRLEQVNAVQCCDETELFDLMFDAMNKASQARLDIKRTMYANIATRHIVDGLKIDETEMALRIVEGLEMVHFEILREALNAPVCGGGPFVGLRVVRLSAVDSLPGTSGQAPIVLRERLPSWQPEALHFAACELLGRGLLHDEGVGRWDSGTMEYLIATDTAMWVHKLVA